MGINCPLAHESKDNNIANSKANNKGIFGYAAIIKIKYIAEKIMNITKYKKPITPSKKSIPERILEAFLKVISLNLYG